MVTNLPFNLASGIEQADEMIAERKTQQGLEARQAFGMAARPGDVNFTALFKDLSGDLAVFLDVLFSIFDNEKFEWKMAMYGFTDPEDIEDRSLRNAALLRRGAETPEQAERREQQGELLRDIHSDPDHSARDMTLPEFIGTYFPEDDSFNAAVQIVLPLEGGYSSQEPRGAVAMYGINSEANPDLADKIKNGTLTVEEAVERYRTNYWETINWDAAGGLDNIPVEARIVAFDASINHGPSFASNILKKSFENHPNDVNAAVNNMLDMREDKYKELIESDPGTYQKYQVGWFNRLDHLRGSIANDIGPTPDPSALPKAETSVIESPDAPSANDEQFTP